MVGRDFEDTAAELSPETFKKAIEYFEELEGSPSPQPNMFLITRDMRAHVVGILGNSATDDEIIDYMMTKALEEIRAINTKKTP